MSDVEVLAVIAAVRRDAWPEPFFSQLRDVEAAVAELIEADKEYDAANLALQCFDSTEMDADEEAATYDLLCARFDAARERRAAALAKAT